MGLRSRFSEKKIFKYGSNQKMTKGKMISDLLKYAKSAIIFFDQSEATFGSHMTTMEASDWSKFFILRPFYPWSFFDPGII